MQFNASLLKEQSLETANKLALENTVANQDSSFIYTMLEHNDIMHKLDTEEKINYYRALAEASTGKCTDIALREGIVDSVHGFLTKVIQAIIDLFNKFIGFIRGRANDAAYKEFEKLSKEFDSIKYGADKNSPLEKNTDVIVHVYPKVSEVPERYFAGSLNNLLDLLDKLLSGENISKDAIDGPEGAKEMAYRALAKAIIPKRNKCTNPVIDRTSFLNCIKENCCYKENRYMKLADFLNEFRPAGECSKEIASKLASIKSVLEKAKSDLNTKSAAMNPENRTKANTIISHCEAISQDCITYFNMISTMNLQSIIYWNKMYKSAKRSSVKESGTIHGEIFNSDTLFDNDDIRDFNRTEWLDLELATECYEISSAIYEYRRRVAVNEAIIISEGGIDTFRKLVAMQEAESKKLGDKFTEIIQTIINAVNDFLSNLPDKISLNAAFIKKNRDIIETKPIKLTNIRSNGDIINGLKRVEDKLDVVPYNYETMKDSLDNERVFFDKYIRGKLNGNLRSGMSWSDTDRSISELCKAYYGASFPEDKVPKIDIAVADVQANIKNIIAFLEAPNALMQSIKSELNTLKLQASKAASEVNADKKDPPASALPEKSSAESKDDTVATETVYYSELYQRCFNELDTQSTQSDGNDNNDAIKPSEDKKSNSDSTFKVYIQAYRSVLLAKLTGAGFVRSELMALIKAHVKSYNPKADVEEKKPAEVPAQQNVQS